MQDWQAGREDLKSLVADTVVCPNEEFSCITGILRPCGFRGGIKLDNNLETSATFSLFYKLFMCILEERFLSISNFIVH